MTECTMSAFPRISQVPLPHESGAARNVYDAWALTYPMRRNVSHLLFPPTMGPSDDLFDEEEVGGLPSFLLDPTPMELLPSYLQAAMLPNRPA